MDLKMETDREDEVRLDISNGVHIAGEGAVGRSTLRDEGRATIAPRTATNILGMSRIRPFSNITHILPQFPHYHG